MNATDRGTASALRFLWLILLFAVLGLVAAIVLGLLYLDGAWVLTVACAAVITYGVLALLRSYRSTWR